MASNDYNMKRIAFVTYQKNPDLTEDDALALPQLHKLGFQAVPAVWDDPALRWEKFDAIILRSCWDYHHNPKVFSRWIDLRAATGSKLWNPARIVRWNMDKIYLHDLAMRGVATPRTVWLEAGENISLSFILKKNHLARAVVKPSISATAFMTFQTSPAHAEADQAKLETILKSSGALVQEFMPEITTHGEWSLLFFSGQYSHAVLKQPQSGDFRVQTDFGGSAHAALPPPQFLAKAQALLRMVDQPLLYARVDGVERDGQFILMELELIEPALFLCAETAAPARFAEAIAEVVQ